MVLAVFLCLGLYLILILYFIAGNQRLEEVSSKNSTNISVSVIIPFRNEENNIENLVSSLTRQSYSNGILEFIFIDDHSEDSSNDLIRQKINQFDAPVKLLSLKETFGKKAAIQKGVEEAIGDMILTTDADCTMNKNWVTTMAHAFEQNEGGLVLGRVHTQADGHPLSNLFLKENDALMKATSGASKMGKPFLSNGANFGYSRTDFRELNPFQNHERIASGDDIFLLHEFKKRKPNKRIQFVMNEDAVVYTKGPTSLKQLVHQRIRWLKKSKYYGDTDTILIGLIIFIANLSVLLSFVLQLFNLMDPIQFFYMLIIKGIADLTLLRIGYTNDSFISDLIGVILLSILYPIYTVSLPLLSLFWKTDWKNRKIQ